MSRYINIDDISLRKTIAVGGMSAKALWRRIQDAPTIDIVRCKECKYWEESQYFQEFMVCTYVKGATFTRQHDDFCSRGERKESE